MDHITPERRSWLMSRVPSKNTKPEVTIRRLLHSFGYRFRIHYKILRGTPDIAFPKRKKIVFVHGCFWHGHEGCRYAKLPASRTEFWMDKMRRNRLRDQEIHEELEKKGWKILIIWQCELKEMSSLSKKLTTFLGPPKVSGGAN